MRITFRSCFVHIRGKQYRVPVNHNRDRAQQALPRRKINVQDASFFQIAVPKMEAYSYRKYQDKISSVQVRELSNCIKNIKKNDEKKRNFSIHDIIEELENDPEGSKNTKQALIGWLSEINSLRLFGRQENPLLNNVVKQGELTIFDLQKEVSIKKKQIILDYVCSRLFYMRRMNQIPPFFLRICKIRCFCPWSFSCFFLLFCPSHSL